MALAILSSFMFIGLLKRFVIELLFPVTASLPPFSQVSP